MATGLLRRPTPAELEKVYPSGDGEPMAETGIHVVAILHPHQALLDALEDSWFIAPDMFWHFEEGNPKARIAPDAMAVPGVGRDERRSFFSWIEGRIPAAVFEMASEGTRKEDLGDRKERYLALGVAEYFLFDPTEEYLETPVIGFRLNGREFERISAEDEDGTLTSRELNHFLRPEGTMLRLIDATSGELDLSREEAVEEAKRRVERERNRAIAERVKLKEQQRLTETERQKAEIERQKVGAERQKAEAEKARADELAPEVERLKALLAKTNS
jgi:Uma2 family endonuclease